MTDFKQKRKKLMNQEFYNKLTQTSLGGEKISTEDSIHILTNKDIELLPLLNATYQVRKHYKSNSVTIHVLNNAQNGHCPEDCSYCPQAKTSDANIEEYPLKSDEEILEEAKQAYESGAFRYCMVSAGRGPSPKRIKKLAQLIGDIKSKYPLEICVSTGLLEEEAAKTLKNAGLDRLNHNLNTSERFYPEICTTHTYQDRVKTLMAAQKANLEVCSGIIVGMGETTQDVIDVALELRQFNAPSIPVNFLVPIEGNVLKNPQNLTPNYCLRVLCLFRLLNPKAEIRVAAGREGHLRSLEIMALYPANSLFFEGYLNTKGASSKKTLQMIIDAGFTIESEININEILKNSHEEPIFLVDGTQEIMKGLQELRPAKV